jgi:hypothetical protein
MEKCMTLSQTTYTWRCREMLIKWIKLIVLYLAFLTTKPPTLDLSQKAFLGEPHVRHTCFALRGNVDRDNRLLASLSLSEISYIFWIHLTWHEFIGRSNMSNWAIAILMPSDSSLNLCRSTSGTIVRSLLDIAESPSPIIDRRWTWILHWPV